ncbi:hypothetical protein [Arenimonas sp.]|uniref:hypothetical protein n=1 Tax=Arenimonas sp. TaxID=1872635 RepID=UPI002E34F9AD|nr:hypothetical protein [Arenimonas sp.]HEX4855072.1 hypothetical protein [Arenimonas sp.]
MFLRRAALVAAWLAASAFPALALAEAPARTAGTSLVAGTGAATPAERAELARRFVATWGGYASEVHGVDLDGWQAHMAATFAQGDADNLREAMRRDTFEGALAALGGVGHRVDDGQIIDALAAAGPAPDIGQALGALGEDLVYNPIQPCRIVDTRVAGGVIGAAQVRSFEVAGAASYASQGGDAGNCGLQGEVPSAVVLNVTAARPAQAGFATVFPHGTVQPLAASVNYAGGDIVNNSIISKVPNPASSLDVSIYTFAESHYVVDVVGYFAPPRTTSLSCVSGGAGTISVGAGQTATVFSPSCPVGYTEVNLDCETSGPSMTLEYSSLRLGGSCRVRNGGTSDSTISAVRRCCRVPGR